MSCGITHADSSNPRSSIPGWRESNVNKKLVRSTTGDWNSNTLRSSRRSLNRTSDLKKSEMEWQSCLPYIKKRSNTTLDLPKIEFYLCLKRCTNALADKPTYSCCVLHMSSVKHEFRLSYVWWIKSSRSKSPSRKYAWVISCILTCAKKIWYERKVAKVYWV